MSDTSDPATAPPRRIQTHRGGPAGDSASRESVSRLRGELGALKAAKQALPFLKRALRHIAGKDYAAAREAAQKAVDRDPSLIHAWHLLAIEARAAVFRVDGQTQRLALP